MATKCPQCHEFVEDDSICCADVRFTWKCKSCSKVTQGFSIPYGKCYLCGGEVEVIKRPKDVDFAALEPIQKGLQLESSAYHFYRLSAKNTNDPAAKEVFSDFMDKEMEHFATIAERYHVHEDLDIDEQHDEKLMAWLLEGIDFSDTKGSLRTVYDRAIQMELKTRDFYLERVEASDSEVERGLYKELAAEEEDHAAILETERDAFFGAE